MEINLIQAIPTKIKFPISFANLTLDTISFIDNSNFHYSSVNDFYTQLFKYMPYCKTKYNSPQIVFLQKMMDLSIKDFAQSQFTSEKAIRKILNCPINQKVDLNWISEKHLRETVYNCYEKNFETQEIDYKDKYYNIIHLQSFLKTPQLTEYQLNPIQFDINYISPDNRFKYFYQS